MADKKFKTGVDLQSTVKISSETPSKALTLDSNGDVKSSSVSDTELGHLSGVTSSVQTQITDAQNDADSAQSDATQALSDASAAQGDATQALSDAAAAQSTADAAIPSAEKGANSGVATLDAGGKIPASQLPNSVMEYKGTHDVSTNSPTLIDGTGNNGDVYKVSVGGSRDYGSGSQTFAAGDWIMYNGTIWEKSVNSDAVDSVNGQQGAVVLDADDIDDASTSHKFASQAQLDKVDHISVTQAVDLDTMESDIATNSAKVSADGSVTSHSDVTDAGSGAIITGAERTTLGTALQPSDNVSELTNDAGYLTTALQSGDNISELTNDSGYITSAPVDSVNAQTGAVVLDTDDISEGSNQYHTTARARSAAVVNSTAGSETDQAASVDAMKSYVSSNGGNLSSGDIKETSFVGADTATDVAVTGLAFANGTVRSFVAQVIVEIDTTSDEFEVFTLMGVQKSSGWDMSVESVGDDTLVSFSITSLGQVQYSKSASAGTFVSNNMKFRADTLSKS